MTVYCFADCHVWLGSSSLCTCLVAMYGYPAPYNPFGPQTPQKAPEVPQERLQAAQEAGARWLSGDGLTAYTMRYGKVLQADWDGARFSSWLDIGEVIPADAVKM